MSANPSGFSSVNYFGRAWALVIGTSTDANGSTSQVIIDSSSWIPEPLHITFEVFQSVLNCFWWADICIYNLSPATLNTLITQGTSVQLSAGYQTNPYGTVFSGVVYQPMWERQDIINYKLTLKCLVGINLGRQNLNFTSGTFGSGFTARQWVANMAANAIVPISILPQDTTSIAALSNVRQSRGGVVHGPAQKYFEQAANFNGLNYWAEAEGAQLLKLQTSSALAPTLTFGANSGLIGTPQQTQFGMNCRVLMTPQVKPRTKIQLAPGTTINQNPLAPGNSLPTVINQSGVYTVAGVRHIGDSRGQDWYTEVTTLLGDEVIQALEAYNSNT